MSPHYGEPKSKRQVTNASQNNIMLLSHKSLEYFAVKCEKLDSMVDVETSKVAEHIELFVFLVLCQ